MTKEQSFEERFEEYMKPKKFFGAGYCTQLWNIECDDPYHKDGREVVVKHKAKAFFKQELKEIVERIEKENEPGLGCEWYCGGFIKDELEKIKEEYGI